MRSRTAVPLLLLVAGCSGDDSMTDVRPDFAIDCTTPTVTVVANPSSATVAAQTSAQARFTVTNSCATASAWNFSSSRTGTVATVGIPNPLAPLIPAGASIVVLVPYTSGSTTGIGSVVLKATADLGSVVKTAALKVTVTAGSVGIPYGISGISLDPITPGAAWTGGIKAVGGPNALFKELDAAKAISPKVGMYFTMTGGDESVFRAPDGHFRLDLWKQALDDRFGGQINVDGTSQHYQRMLPYITQDSVFLGIQLLDDLAGFDPDVSFADVEAIAAHSKKRFPALATMVRDRATVLKARAPVCSTCPGGRTPFTKLDAARAQYHSGLGTPAAFRDDEIRAARDMKLGLILGINITKGIRPAQDPVPPATLNSWGNDILKSGESDYACGFLMWDEQYDLLYGFDQPVFDNLAALAANHTRSSCKRR